MSQCKAVQSSGNCGRYPHLKALNSKHSITLLTPNKPGKTGCNADPGPPVFSAGILGWIPFLLEGGVRLIPPTCSQSLTKTPSHWAGTLPLCRSRLAPLHPSTTSWWPPPAQEAWYPPQWSQPGCWAAAHHPVRQKPGENYTGVRAFQEASGNTAGRKAFYIATKAWVEMVSSENAKKTYWLIFEWILRCREWQPSQSWDAQWIAAVCLRGCLCGVSTFYP